MDDEAAASAMGFVVGGVFFLGVVAVLFNFVIANIPPEDAADQVDEGRGLQSQSLLNRFVRAGGTLGFAGGMWDDDPSAAELNDGDAQPGLGGGLGPVLRLKLDALADGAVMTKSADGVLTYGEAKSWLGLDGLGLDFRLVARLSTSSGQACDSAASPWASFGPDPPVQIPMEPAQASFVVAGDCASAAGAGTALLQVTLVVFPAVT